MEVKQISAMIVLLPPGKCEWLPVVGMQLTYDHNISPLQILENGYGVLFYKGKGVVLQR